MKWLRFLKKKPVPQALSEPDTYAQMGAVGVSPALMKTYQDATNKIKQMETKGQDTHA